MDRSRVPIGIEEKVAFLSTPAAYGNTKSVLLKETHMSWVFLTEAHAWKLKKPVRYDHLDFSTPDARRQNCEQEVLLNRRLAPDVYLGVVPLTIVYGNLRLGGSGTAVDWLVQMRRLPADRMLDQTIADHSWKDDDLRKVGELLAGFYQVCPPAKISGSQYRKLLSKEFRAAGEELQRPEYALPVELIGPIQTDGIRLIEENVRLLEDRVRAGKIVDGHGDLRAEHICLESRPVIIDCLEFNSSLRMLDSASELAFLKLECERLGAIEAGERIAKVCSERTGDWPAAPLLQFYKTYHACVRAKLALWHLKDAPEMRVKWIERAKTYLRLAVSVL